MATGKRCTEVLLFAILFFLISLAAQGCAQAEETRTGLAEYVHETTGIKTEDLCIEEFGEIKQGEGEAKSAYICLRLKKGGLEEIKNRIKEAGGSPIEDPGRFPSENSSEPAVAKFTGETESVEAGYQFLLDGFNGAKTRTVFLYLTIDSGGNEFLYMFDHG